MMGVSDCLEHPGLATAVRRIRQALEEGLANRATGGLWGLHKREPRAAIRILSPFQAPSTSAARDGELLRERAVVRLGQLEADTPSGPLQTRSSHRRAGAVIAASRSAENHAD